VTSLSRQSQSDGNEITCIVVHSLEKQRQLVHNQEHREEDHEADNRAADDCAMRKEAERDDGRDAGAKVLPSERGGGQDASKDEADDDGGAAPRLFVAAPDD
jgi:hypothetical protein